MSEISLAWIGTRTVPFRDVVSERRLMNFAAALQSHRTSFYDDRAAEGLAVFPTFSYYFSWQAVSQLWERLRELGASERVINQQVHYRSLITNHRAFVAGETVIVTAEVTDLRRHRAGSLLTTTVNVTAEDGSLISQEIVEGLLRGIDSPAEAKEFLHASAPQLDGPAAQVLDIRFRVGQLLAHHYDGCADIHFPIHTSARVAHQAGLPGIIVQGSATLGLCVDRILDWLLPPAERAFVPQIAGTFGTFLQPGSEVRLQAQAGSPTPDTLEVIFSLFSQDDREIIRNGHIAISR